MAYKRPETEHQYKMRTGLWRTANTARKKQQNAEVHLKNGDWKAALDVDPKNSKALEMKSDHDSPAQVAVRAKAAYRKLYDNKRYANPADLEAARLASIKADQAAAKAERGKQAAEAKIRAAAKAEEKRVKDEARQKALANETPEQKERRAEAARKEALFKEQQAERDAVAKEKRDAYEKSPEGIAERKKNEYAQQQTRARQALKNVRYVGGEMVHTPLSTAQKNENERRRQLERVELAGMMEKNMRSFELAKRHDLMGVAWDEKTGWDWEDLGDEKMRAARVMVYGADGKLFLPKDQKERDEVTAHWDKVLANAPELNKAWKDETELQWNASKDKYREEFNHLLRQHSQYIDKNLEGDNPLYGTKGVHPEGHKYAGQPYDYRMSARELEERNAKNDVSIASNKLKDMLRGDEARLASGKSRKYTEEELSDKDDAWWADKIEAMVMNAMIDESRGGATGKQMGANQFPMSKLGGYTEPNWREDWDPTQGSYKLVPVNKLAALCGAYANEAATEAQRIQGTKDFQKWEKKGGGRGYVDPQVRLAQQHMNSIELSKMLILGQLAKDKGENATVTLDEVKEMITDAKKISKDRAEAGKTVGDPKEYNKMFPDLKEVNEERQVVAEKKDKAVAVFAKEKEADKFAGVGDAAYGEETKEKTWEDYVDKVAPYKSGKTYTDDYYLDDETRKRKEYSLQLPDLNRDGTITDDEAKTYYEDNPDFERMHERFRKELEQRDSDMMQSWSKDERGVLRGSSITGAEMKARAEAEREKAYIQRAAEKLRFEESPEGIEKAEKERNRMAAIEAERQRLRDRTPEEVAADTKKEIDAYADLWSKRTGFSVEGFSQREKSLLSTRKDARLDIHGNAWNETEGRWMEMGADDTPEMKATRVMVKAPGEKGGTFDLPSGRKVASGELFVPTPEERKFLYDRIDSTLEQVARGEMDPADPMNKWARGAFVERGLSGALIKAPGMDTRMFLKKKDADEYKKLKEEFENKPNITPAEIVQKSVSSESRSAPLVAGDEVVSPEDKFSEVGKAAYSQDVSESSSSQSSQSSSESGSNDPLDLNRDGRVDSVDYEGMSERIFSEQESPQAKPGSKYYNHPNAVRQRKLDEWRKNKVYARFPEGHEHAGSIIPGQDPPDELMHKSTVTQRQTDILDLDDDGFVSPLDALLLGQQGNLDKRTPAEKEADSIKAREGKDKMTSPKSTALEDFRQEITGQAVSPRQRKANIKDSIISLMKTNPALGGMEELQNILRNRGQESQDLYFSRKHEQAVSMGLMDEEGVVYEQLPDQEVPVDEEVPVITEEDDGTPPVQGPQDYPDNDPEVPVTDEEPPVITDEEPPVITDEEPPVITEPEVPVEPLPPYIPPIDWDDLPEYPPTTDSDSDSDSDSDWWTGTNPFPAGSSEASAWAQAAAQANAQAVAQANAQAVANADAQAKLDLNIDLTGGGYGGGQEQANKQANEQTVNFFGGFGDGQQQQQQGSGDSFDAQQADEAARLANQEARDKQEAAFQAALAAQQKAMNERLKNAMDAEVRQQAVVAYARANDNKWNSIQAIMGQLGDQRRALKEDAWGPLAFVNTTTGGRARYLNAPDEKGGRGAVVDAGWQPRKIDTPSAEDVAQIFSASKPSRSLPNQSVQPKQGLEPLATASQLSPIQQQRADAMGGAASGIMAQKNAEIARGAEMNEWANKAAASQHGLDLAKFATGLGAQERAVKQGLDKQMVAGILPVMSAQTPPILQQGLKKAYTG